MHTRRALHDDFEKIVALQDENLDATLSVEQKRDGFLSGRFSVEQFANFNANGELGIIVCIKTNAGTNDETNAELMGYLVTSMPEDNAPSTVAGAMIARFPTTLFRGQPIATLRILIGGPICVAKQYRGQGVFEALYRVLPEQVAPSYELAVVLVSTNNPRSIRAHEKVGMETIDTFHFAGRDFLTLAKRLRAPKE